jgi:hypothetical protein
MSDNTSNHHMQNPTYKLVIMSSPADTESDLIEERRNKKIPIPLSRRTDNRELLCRWLKQKCYCADNIFMDPGYSSFYKNEFNITDGDEFRPIYETRGDIDVELNKGYVDYLYGDEKNEEDEELEQFIDYVPIHVSQDVLRVATGNTRYEEKEYIIEMMSRKNLLILPGSNHSNANFLYKRLIRCLEDTEVTFSIPFVSGDRSVPYTDVHKDVDMDINKEQFYDFLRRNSRNR